MRLLTLPACLLLSACIVPVPIPVPEGTPGAIEVVLDEGDSCGARDLRQLIGQPGAGVAGARIVGADGLPVPVRVIGPDDAVTQDFNPARVNLRTDASGTITAVDCG
jgi:hypothetical protein